MSHTYRVGEVAVCTKSNSMHKRGQSTTVTSSNRAFINAHSTYYRFDMPNEDNSSPLSVLSFGAGCLIDVDTSSSDVDTSSSDSGGDFSGGGASSDW